MAIRTFASRRNSLRLAGFEYSDRRWYFITVCTAGRQPLFGAITPHRVELSAAGHIVEDEWRRSADLRLDVNLDVFIVMPDHFHGLIGLYDSFRAERRSSLPRLIGAFKGAVTRRIRSRDPGNFTEIWQRSYHDAVIRSARHFENVRRYIIANPAVAWRARRLPG
jgi:REP element-mobilizing transposase RayT